MATAKRSVPSGSGTTYTILGDSITCKAHGGETGGGWSLFEFTSPHGGAVPLHRHEWDEAYFVLEGSLGMVVDGEPVTLTSGDFLNVPGRTPHSLANASGAPVRYLMWAKPAGAERFFEALDAAARKGTLDIPAILAIAASNGIEALPPG